MIETDRETFAALADDGPAIVRVAADLDVDVAPLTAYDALVADADDHAFLLESAEKTPASDPDGAFTPDTTTEETRHARYSFVGYDPAAVVTVGPDDTTITRLRDDPITDLLDAPDHATGDVLDRLRSVMPAVPRRNIPAEDRQLLDGGLVGFLAYDAVYDLWLDEVGVERPPTPLPDAEFAVTTRTLVFDRATDSVSLVCTPVADADTATDVYDALEAEAKRVQAVLRDATAPATAGIEVTAERAGDRDAYTDAVETAATAVRDGEVYQAVVSRTRELDGDIDPRALYDALRAVNPSPYMFLLAHGDHTVVGASPETLVAVHDDTVVTNPIAGTCQRGASPVADRRLAGEMLADEKERAEHTMLVDLARNDVRRVSAPGTVSVPEFMRVLKYSHVQHIESTVTGTLAADADAFDATRAAFPAGTLSGAPKVRAMEHIDAIEATPRGIYGGGVGYFSWTGDAELAITIRSGTITHTGDEDTLTVRAGAGVVADSDPDAEYEETEAKMDGVLAAVDRLRTTDDGEAVHR
ncbi:anthranilate synthase component I [Halobacterium salinarum]|uniref:anthranilate synthase component I n=1 Tax=Halobacterium salinarum TaxID=2242 RepID=UPI0025563A47|nr:anthranilate synthase component I [Halobacterium salinarum]MDL0125272.1 anthranilate synthase component I [Halobacterium salinarum]